MEFGKLEMDTELQTKQLSMKLTSSDAKLPTQSGDQNKNLQSTNKIQCSVCEEKYDNITEYTHHLNMHLFSTQPAKDMENPQESGSKQTETCSSFETKAELPIETGNKMELDMDLYNGQFAKDIENESIIKVKMQTTINVGHSLEKWESNLKQSESDFTFQSKAEFQNERGNNSEFIVDQATENRENSKKWGNDFNEPESNSLFKIKLESQAEREHKKGFWEKSKQNTVPITLNIFPCTFCEKTFSQSGTMSRHVNAVHKKTETFHMHFV